MGTTWEGLRIRQSGNCVYHFRHWCESGRPCLSYHHPLCLRLSWCAFCQRSLHPHAASSGALVRNWTGRPAGHRSSVANPDVLTSARWMPRVCPTASRSWVQVGNWRGYRQAFFVVVHTHGTYRFVSRRMWPALHWCRWANPDVLTSAWVDGCNMFIKSLCTGR